MSKDGLYYRCKSCVSKETTANYKENEAHRLKAQERARQWIIDNPGKNAAKAKAYYYANKDKIMEKSLIKQKL